MKFIAGNLTLSRWKWKGTIYSEIEISHSGFWRWLSKKESGKIYSEAKISYNGF